LLWRLRELAQGAGTFCLRLKRSEFIQIEEMGAVKRFRLSPLPILPGCDKKQKVVGFNVACKWKGKYRNEAPEEVGFILTNVKPIICYYRYQKKRFCIEEMFRDLQKFITWRELVSLMSG